MSWGFVRSLSSSCEINPMSTDLQYEAEPKIFEESYRPGDFPDDLKSSEYRVLTWILIKIGTVKKIRNDIDKRAVNWPDIRDIIERREDIIAFIEDQASNYETVMSWLNQYAQEYASLVFLKSAYDYIAYKVWVGANGGVKNEFDRALYHLTGYRVCRSVSA